MFHPLQLTNRSERGCEFHARSDASSVPPVASELAPIRGGETHRDGSDHTRLFSETGHFFGAFRLAGPALSSGEA